MSKFLQPAVRAITPYVPGEQPAQKYIKLNTNESPFPPSPLAIKYSAEAVKKANLYPPLDGGKLRPKLAEYLGLGVENVAVTNSSDEALNFIVKAFCSKDSPAAFLDITYGFYPVFCELSGVPYEEIPLNEDFTVDVSRFLGIGKNIFLANPNAPTGLSISLEDLARICDSNPDNIVVSDEAYVDFGGKSAIPILKDHPNLIVVQTFSKSRSLAGARVGFACAAPDIIRDLYTVIYSTNPYNLSRANMYAAIGALEDDGYTKANCREVARVREITQNRLRELGFVLTQSEANFIFCMHPEFSGKELYERLRAEGILVRRFDKKRIENRLRITVGTEADMDTLCKTLEKIIGRR